MGYGGHVVLVNGTPYTWDLVDHNAYQMEWEFQRDALTVEPYNVRRVYVEARTTLFKKSEDDAGNASYRLRGTDSLFEIQARWLNLSAYFKSMSTKAANLGDVVSLGHISDRPSYFVLSGRDGDYNSVGNVHDWMQRSMSQLGRRTLRQLCIPGSHDSGMCKVTFKSLFASASTVATQHVPVREQLQYGIRYLDIRPVLYRNDWSCGHWTFIEPKEWTKVSPYDTWQGGNGESIREIIDGINDFTKSSHELVVVSLYRAFSIHNTPGAFRRGDFSEPKEENWQSLLNLLTGESGLRNLWTPKEGDLQSESFDLTSVPLRSYIGDSKAAVLVLADDSVDLTGRHGCFNYKSWPWNGSEWDKPENERLKAFLEKASEPNVKAYAYSGCHTQSDEEAILSTLGQSSQSVLELAKSPKDKLFTELFPACTEKIHPAAMTMDAIDSSDLTALALAINDRLLM